MCPGGDGILRPEYRGHQRSPGAQRTVGERSPTATAPPAPLHQPCRARSLGTGRARQARPGGRNRVPEQTVASQRLYQGKVVNLRIDTVRLEDGREARREIVEHGGAVAIVPVDAEGQVLLVRQFRTPIGAVLLEVPAGGIDAGENPDEAVQRELQEETGYWATRIDRLGGFWVAPGYCTEYIHVYRAEGLIESRLDADEDESITVERYSVADALEMVRRGEICDAKSIVGLLQLAACRDD